MGTTQECCEAAPHKTAVVQPCNSYLTNPLSIGTIYVGEVMTNISVAFSYGFLHMDTPVLTEVLFFCNGYNLRILDSIIDNYCKRGKDGEKNTERERKKDIFVFTQPFTHGQNATCGSISKQSLSGLN